MTTQLTIESGGSSEKATLIFKTGSFWDASVTLDRNTMAFTIQRPPLSEEGDPDLSDDFLANVAKVTFELATRYLEVMGPPPTLHYVLNRTFFETPISLIRTEFNLENLEFITPMFPIPIYIYDEGTPFPWPGAIAALYDQIWSNFEGNQIDSDEYRETQPADGLSMLAGWTNDFVHYDLYLKMHDQIIAWITAENGTAYGGTEEFRPLLKADFDRHWVRGKGPFGQDAAEMLNHWVYELNGSEIEGDDFFTTDRFWSRQLERVTDLHSKTWVTRAW